MARVTVEDCEAVVRNRFQLVVLANQRVKQYQNGAPLTIARDNDKDPVVALREIAYQTISIDKLKEATIDSFRQVFENEEEDFVDDDNYDPSSFAVGTGASTVNAANSEEDEDDDQVEPEASIDFSCIIEDNQD